MSDVEPWAVLLAAVLSFLAAGVYCGVLGATLERLSTATVRRPPAVVVPFELAKGVVLALAVAWLAARAGLDDALGGIGLGLVLWVAFPGTVLASSVVHEGVAPRLAVLHAGDWLLKLVIVGAVIGLWG